MTKYTFLIIFICISSLLRCEIIPDWVFRIPSESNITYAVGVSDKYLEEDTALENAFDMACYEMACQKKASIQAKSLDIVGSDFVFFETVLPDSSDVFFYKETAKRIAHYSDSRYTYLLIATDSVKVTTNLIKINIDDLRKLKDTCYEENDNITGFGSSNYISALGFLYAANRAKVNICEQISNNVMSITKDESLSTVSVNRIENKLTLYGLRISGYYVDYKTNIITAFAEYNK